MIMAEQNLTNITSLIDSFKNGEQLQQLLQQNRNLAKLLQQKMVELCQKDTIIFQLQGKLHHYLQKQKKIVLYEQKITKLQNRINMLEDLMNRSQEFSFDQINKTEAGNQLKIMQCRFSKQNRKMISHNCSLTQRSSNQNISNFTGNIKSRRQKTECSQLSNFQAYKPNNYQNSQLKFLGRQRILTENVGTAKNRTVNYDRYRKEDSIRDNKGLFDHAHGFKSKTYVYDQIRQRQNRGFQLQGVMKKRSNRSNIENTFELESYKRERLIYTPTANQFLKIHKCYQNFKQ